ncbi:hypothetical protein Mgra_00005525 [Meloidogyne graminicola]|uniref:Apple domain-containing protein n=1 Tax=Meloidogyne graminicola TaxID=189291 RepID=A0A8S9ZPE1_9BILA|nr:hypothetical protein Mgra_00005525 [Meloidogyne graminicola]
MYYYLIFIYLLFYIYFVKSNPQFNEEKQNNFNLDNNKQQQQQQFLLIKNIEHLLEERNDERNERRTAFAAPINNNNNLLITQQQNNNNKPFNSVLLNGENKQFFKIHYRDGIQKAIFDETQRRIPPDFEENNDLINNNFDIYDDSNLIEPNKESSIFVPLIYRNETSSEEALEKKKLLSLVTAKPQKLQTIRPLVAPELLGKKQITIRTTSPKPSTTPIVRPPPPPPPPTIAQLVPSQTILPIITTTTTIKSQIITRRPLTNNQGIQQQSHFISPQQPKQQQSFNNNIASIRTGVCQQSIFYTTQQVTGLDILKSYTHFAVVVSVDQCARTCHEFNCEVAILDPNTKHCQFNPSTAFRLSSECPQWPNHLYKNNALLGIELIKIQCITCQRKKKKTIFLPNINQQNKLSSQHLLFSNPSSNNQQQQQTFNLRRPQFGQFNGNNDAIQRIANAVKIININNNFGINPLIRPIINKEKKTEMVHNGGFNKLNRLIKSLEEDYFDLENKNNSININNGNKKIKIKEVTSWREGHPQGEGFSPLKINPLRNWRRPTL